MEEVSSLVCAAISASVMGILLALLIIWSL